MICKICGLEFEDKKPVVTRDYNYQGDEEFRYFECPGCHCLQIERVPENLERYYGEKYYSFSMRESQNKKQTENVIQKFMKLRDLYELSAKMGGGGYYLGKLLARILPRTAYRYIGKYCKKESPILDLGCGDGYLLRLLKELGYKDLTGLDKFLGEAWEEEGLSIRAGSIEDSDKMFEFIMLNHSFEHMEDPQTVLEEIDKKLVSGGTCMICIPVSDSLAFALYGKYWVQLDAPRHLFLHSPESMKVMLRHTNMKIKKIIYDSSAFQFIGSRQYQRGVSGKERRKLSELILFAFLSLVKYGRLARRANCERRGDQAIFILHKE